MSVEHLEPWPLSRLAFKGLPSADSTGRATLVGRTSELNYLLSALRNVVDATDSTGLVEVTGEAGIGKTALLGEFAELARAQGTTVLFGHAVRGATEGPFGLFADAFDDHHVIPERDRTDGRQSPRDVRNRLDHLTAKPLVLIVDDCHLSDSASLAPLATLLRRPPQRGSVLFVLGFRDRQAGTELRSIISDRSWRLLGAQIRLGALSEQDFHRLLADWGTASWRRELYRESGGNPGYVTAILAERTADRGSSSPRVTNRASSHHSAGYLAELASAGPAARTVATGAAVIGDEFDVDLLTTVLEQPEPAVLAAVDELIQLDLMRPQEGGRHYVFRHPVVRRAIYADSDLRSRISLHGRADTALRARGVPPVVRAPHVEHWIRHGDLAAVDLLAGAADAVSSTTPRKAVRWLRTALRALPDLAETVAVKARLLVSLAKALGTSGQLAECWKTMHEALRILAPRQRDLRAEAVASIAAVERMLGTHGSAEVMLREELAARSREVSSHKAALLLEIAHTELVKGGASACREWARAALAVARQCGDRALEASCLGLIGKTDGTVGDSGSARAHLAEATAILDGMLDDEFTANLAAVTWIGWSEILLERWHDAARHFDKAIDRATVVNNGLVLPHLLVGQVMALRARGRLLDARASARYAVDLAESSGSQEQLFGALATLAWANAYFGDVDPAVQAAADALAEGDGVVGWQGILALRMVAEARLMNDDPDGCLAVVSAAGGPNLSRSNKYSRVNWYELLTRAELEAGRPEEAAKWAELAVSAGALLDHSGRTALGQLATAHVLLVTDPPAALPLAQQAVAGMAATGATLDELRARVTLGVAMWHADRPDESARELRNAQHGLERMGARGLAKQASRERRRLVARGARPGRGDAASRPAVSLTRREQQIANLVHDGLTNRQISRKLHIAEKTVEMHLTNLFSKLGVSNRAGVAVHVTGSKPLPS